jgi:hypothetical protein
MNECQDFDFDRLVLGVAAEQAIAEIADGGSVLVLLNVDFEVFFDRQRTERYVAACQALDTRRRERLVLVLSDMPKGFPKSRVPECVMRVRPFCHGIDFQSDSTEATSRCWGRRSWRCGRTGGRRGRPGIWSGSQSWSTASGPRSGPTRGILGPRKGARQTGG